jgi:hypothetical protein
VYSSGELVVPFIPSMHLHGNLDRVMRSLLLAQLFKPVLIRWLISSLGVFFA